MSRTPLSFAQQLAICQQVARLAHAKLPIPGELARVARAAQPSLARAAEVVDERLAAGEPLTTALADERTHHGRVLVACIDLGQRSGQLAASLRSWTGMHIATVRDTRSLRSAMLYPSLLIVITLISLGYVFQQLVPEYRDTYAMFSERLPAWLELLVDLHQQLPLLSTVVLLLILSPLLVWFWYRSRRDSSGLPRDTAKRLRVHALATELASLGLAAEIPLSQLVTWCVKASGAKPAEAEAAFGQIQKQNLPPHLARETSLLLCSLHAGLIALPEARQHLDAVAEHLRSSADRAATQAARWLPMLVALIVGIIVVLVYVCLIYLPWILLLQRIGASY